MVFDELQRDMAERGHSLESIKASIEARKPDFDAYIGKSYYHFYSSKFKLYIYIYIHHLHQSYYHKPIINNISLIDYDDLIFIKL